MSRPKEPPRVRLGIRVKPSTHKAIIAQVVKTDRNLNSTGKVVDRMVEQEP